MVEVAQVVLLAERVAHQLPVHGAMAAAGVEVLVVGDADVGELRAELAEPLADVEGAGGAVDVDEDEAGRLAARHLRQPVRAAVEAGEAGAVGGVHEPPVEPVGPAVEGAHERASAAAATLRHGHPPVAADVAERPHDAVVAADDQHGHVGDARA